MKDKLSGKQALGIIVGSVVIVLSLFFGARLGISYIKKRRALDEKYKIVAIVQKSHSYDYIKTPYLAELLGLSVDQPVNLYAFDQKEAYQKLQETKVFKELNVHAYRPGVIFVEYTLRTPRALIIDFENRAIDTEGKLFPMTPFFTAKNIPEIYLGSYDQKRIDFALELMQFVKDTFPQASLQRLDVSRAFSKSANREIVLLIKTAKIEYLLRVTLKTYQEDLSRFFAHLSTFDALHQDAGIAIIDLRVPQIALTKGERGVVHE